jgi:hypothetical protein
MRLTRDNYYSREADLIYFSASQIKTFMDCPARAMAELNGEYAQPESPALLVGSYVDAYFEGPEVFERFKAEHPNIFKRDGTLKSEYLQADEMIERARRDKVFMEFMDGDKQVILTGTIFGYPFKAKPDVRKLKERIVDLKTVKDFEPLYKAEQGRISFAEYWGWTLQMAIYQTVEGNQLPTFLNCITKQSPPDIGTIFIPQHHIDAELAVLAEKLPYFDAIKQGVIEPPRCERCAYCRATKQQAGPISLDELTEY